MELKPFHTISRDTRQKHKMTQNTLAKKLDVTGAYIAKIEKGGQCPSPKFLKKMAEVLNLDILDLFLAAQLENKYPDQLQKRLQDLMNHQKNIAENLEFKEFFDRLMGFDDQRQTSLINIFKQIMKFSDSSVGRGDSISQS